MCRKALGEMFYLTACQRNDTIYFDYMGILCKNGSFKDVDCHIAEAPRSDSRGRRLLPPWFPDVIE